MILDVTAGFRRMWKGKHQGVLFLDERRVVKPDIVASNEQLPFRDNVFTKVVYDPPHHLEGSYCTRDIFPKEKFLKLYGEGWKRRIDFIKNVVGLNAEAYRVLKPKGQLFAKFCELASLKVTRDYFLSLLDNFVLLRNRTEISKSGHYAKNKIYYLTLQRCNHEG